MREEQRRRESVVVWEMPNLKTYAVVSGMQGWDCVPAVCVPDELLLRGGSPHGIPQSTVCQHRKHF